VENQHGDTQDAKSHSAMPYVVVWVMLMGLTLLTWITGSMHLQNALLVAVAIALTKSALVVLIFMHMNEASPATRLVFLTSLIFMALLIVLTVSDVATRFTLATPAGAPFGTERAQPDGRLDHEQPADE
jgi:cytochrome c oxidase subunit 4